MSDDDPDFGDETIPLEAVRGLDEATRQTLAAGLPIVVVRDGKLVRIEGDTVVVLRDMPPEIKVTGPPSENGPK